MKNVKIENLYSNVTVKETFKNVTSYNKVYITDKNNSSVTSVTDIDVNIYRSIKNNYSVHLHIGFFPAIDIQYDNFYVMLSQLEKNLNKLYKSNYTSDNMEYTKRKIYACLHDILLNESNKLFN